jgi:ketosteroid isomerase-like protein
MTTPEDVVRLLFQRFTSGDRQGAVELFHPDAVFACAAPGPLHGEHRGHGGILRFWSEQDRLAGGRVQPQLLDLAASDRNVFLLVRLGGAPRPNWRRVVVYPVADGRITGARVFEDDPEAAAAFFAAVD